MYVNGAIPFPIEPIRLTSLTANLDPPQPVGSSITFAAQANGGGAPLEYRWWVLSAGTWVMVLDWKPVSSITWTPSAPDSGYKVGVWVRRVGGTEHGFGAVSFPVVAR